ncbi:helix-turn-helix domain-containing protein [Desulfovibrio sp. OttesenSCG-928-C06]|nr:helix-turn-helix domain-containing protein [Desulfovibrio sp. OttesenSCG-928-C06]
MGKQEQEIVCKIKQYRKQRGWSQDDLARQIQVRRQAVYDMESGRYLPNTALALRLAQVFGCKVEDLFMLPDCGTSAPVHLLGTTSGREPDSSHSDGTRLALGMVRDRLVGIPLDGSAELSMTLRPADGLLDNTGKSARLLSTPDELNNALLLMGCDPALELLAAHIERLLPSGRIHRLFASSRKALTALASGEAHVAATHFHSSTHSGTEANVTAVRDSMSGMPCRIIGFSFMEEGIMTARGNPFGLHEAADLANPAIRFINREEGAALRKLLDDHLRKTGTPVSAVPGYGRTVRSHKEGAAHVTCGAADAALGLRVVAEAFGLDFVPLAATRCDLVLPLDLEATPTISTLLDTLQSSRLRRELAGLPGYDSSFTGAEIAILT